MKVFNNDLLLSFAAMSVERFEEHRDFVVVVIAALKLATGEEFKPETVSDVLAKTTD